MITASRNLLVVLTAFVGAFLVSALGQGAFSAVFPNLSSRGVGNTDISTYVLLLLIAFVFFLFGFAVPRWLRGGMPLVWLLLPIVSAYTIAIIGQPYVYRCSPFAFAGCWVVQSPFVVGAVAVVMGYMHRRNRNAV
jgi:hypothetical protein